MSPRPSRLIFCAGNYSIEYLKATTLLLEELAELNDYHCIQEYAAKVLQKIQGNVDIYY